MEKKKRRPKYARNWASGNWISEDHIRINEAVEFLQAESREI